MAFGPAGVFAVEVPNVAADTIWWRKSTNQMSGEESGLRKGGYVAGDYGDSARL